MSRLGSFSGAVRVCGFGDRVTRWKRTLEHTVFVWLSLGMALGIGLVFIGMVVFGLAVFD